MRRFLIRSALGETYGPVTANQLRSWIMERRLTLDMFIHQEGTPHWYRVCDVPVLRREFAKVPQVSGQGAAPTQGTQPRYWLADPGGAPRGPYEVGAIATAFLGGQLLGSELLCSETGRDWHPMRSILEHHNLIEPAVEQAPDWETDNMSDVVQAIADNINDESQEDGDHSESEPSDTGGTEEVGGEVGSDVEVDGDGDWGELFDW